MWYERYERRERIVPKGGIKAQSKRGSFGASWWGQKWVRTLESFDIGARLARGRSYARGGQVLNIDIAPGKVAAKVQGSTPRPYAVSIELKPLSPADWDKVTAALGGQAVFAAKLLAGEMPAEIEPIFADNGLSLFPAKSRDLATDCSCPDSSNPCKHIAAVYYLIAEEFDRDPFLLFRLRGMDRETLFRKLSASVAEGDHDEEVASLPAEPLPTEVAAFWTAGVMPDDLLGDERRTPVSAALPRRLGAFPFWRGGERFLDAMESAYGTASRSADGERS